MRVLLANLRQFYQCRRLWIVYLLWVFFSYPLFQVLQSGDAALLGLVIIALPGVWIAGTLQEEVSTKPFSFCLPGFRGNVRRLVLLTGVILCATGGLYFAVNSQVSNVSGDAFVLTSCLAFCFTWSIYLGGAALMLAIGSNGMMGIAYLICVGAGFLGSRHPEVNHVLLDHPFVFISLAFVTTAVWWRLVNPAWFRKRSGKPVAGLLFLSDRSMRQLARKNVAARGIPEFPLAFDRHLLGIIHSSRYSAPVKSLAGIVYTAVAPLLMSPLRSKMGVLGVLLLSLAVLAAGYMPGLGFFIIWMAVLGPAGAIEQGAPMFSEMLIHGGRRERFCATAVFVAISAGLLTAVLMLPALMLNLLSPWLPDVRIGGSTFTFHPVSLGLPMLPMIVIPLSSLLEFSLHASRWGRTVHFAVLWAALMLLLYTSMLVDDLPAIPPLTLAYAAILSWLVFPMGVHRIAMRSDLVRR
jgi:hypothetical protein